MNKDIHFTNFFNDGDQKRNEIQTQKTSCTCACGCSCSCAGNDNDARLNTGLNALNPAKDSGSTNSSNSA